MFRNAALISSVLAAVANGQLAGTLTAEKHPSLPAQKCTSSGCTTVNTAITLDSNWRWLHTASGSDNCYTGNAFNATHCPDNKTCAQKCALDGADYSGTYGITTSGSSLTLKFVTKGTYGSNVGSRVYLMASDTKYQMLKLLNQEFTFDVDVSKLPCGFNGALYLSEMLEDGGMSKEPLNKAGAKYGTGYCDAQCPHDIKFIGGEANSEGWTASPNDSNAGSGKYGTCCPEMDIWEANSISTAYTPHPCRDAGPFRCSGTECGDGADRYSGVCDKDGCDFNSYRLGNQTFYGKGKTIDTSKVVTVVTQFITTTGTSSGTLKEIRRKYVQGGKVINNSVSQIAGLPEVNSLTDDFCKSQKTVFGDNDHFGTRGGMAGMSASMNRGMVLSLSIWGDYTARMLWLDSTYPTDSTKVGATRGECSTDSGNPDDLIKNSPDASVTFSNIRWGDLDSTYKGSTTNPPPVSSTSSRGGSSSTPNPSPTSQPGSVPKWGQCGGINYNGPTTCSGSTCTKINDWYYQCL